MSIGKPCLISFVLALGLATAAAAQTPAWQPGPSSASAFLQLSSTLEFLGRLETEESPMQRGILLRSAIDSLTVLYQLHGCAWAREQLALLYARPDCPPFMAGYSADGRLRVQVELLELQNPAFDNYSVLLVTLESQTALPLTAGAASPVLLTSGGQTIAASRLEPGHPAWAQLEKQAPSFAAPRRLTPGSGMAFKQLFAAQADDSARFSAVSFDWGEYQLQLEDFSMPEPEDE